jgi:hypothetical protein
MTEMTGRVRYIGITCRSLDDRFSGHIADTSRSRFDHKTNWLRSLIDKSEWPLIVPIREGLTVGRAEWLERLLIRLLQRPFLLVNSHEGGSTGLAGMSPEAREKHRLACSNPDKVIVYAAPLTNDEFFERRCNAFRNRVQKKFELTPDFEKVRPLYENLARPSKVVSPPKALDDDCPF